MTRAGRGSLQVAAALAVLTALPAAAQHATGLILATPDELRGVPLASAPYSGAELPARVDLSADMPPPQDQGNQKSCVGWAVAYALKSYQEKVEERQPLTTGDGRADLRRVFSPAFIYNQINNGRDGGSRFEDALRLMEMDGAATWADMPYDPGDYQRRPSAQAQAAARRYKIDTWRQVNVRSTQELKAHLNAGVPVIFGAQVDEGFLRAGSGFVWNARGGADSGGHAMVLVGYDDSRRAFRLLNSWGTQWGEGGYGWVSYDYLPRVANEAYVAKDAINGPPPAVVDRGPDAPPPPPPQITPPRGEVQFAITNVSHNAVFPEQPGAYFMRFDGWLEIPPGHGAVDQVVIFFFFDAGGGQKGPPVRSVNAAYATVDGSAACGTLRYPIPAEGLRTTWAAWIPYDALYLYAGQWVQGPSGPVYQPYVSALLAEPVLYVDNFGVRSGGVVPFTVTR